MNEMQIFQNEEFGQVRTMIIDGQPWFVGVDIATALGYKKPTGAINTNVDEGDSRREGVSDANGHRQTAIVINESGLYSLIFGSKLDSAKRFKKWVTSEVLPSIRKTGSYGTPQLPQSPMELLELHYKAIREVDGKVESLFGDLQNVRSELQAFKEDMPVLGIEESRITKAVNVRGVKCLGGKNTNAYRNKSLRQKVYRDIYGQLYRKFGISTYRALKRNQTETAIGIIERYELPMALDQSVKNENAQMTIDME